MSGEAAPARSGGVPSGTQVRFGQNQAPGFPQSPQNVGDPMGARTIGGRGPSLNGAPTTNFDPGSAGIPPSSGRRSA